MNSSVPTVEQLPSFPRYFKIGKYWVNSYKVFLCIGIYVGTLVSAIVAHSSGISPLWMGMGCVCCAIVGMIGARLFFLLVHAREFARPRFWADVWNPKRGGWSVFGGLAIVPFSNLLTDIVPIEHAVFWDHMSCGIVAGAVFVRFGCVCNGCCGGQPTLKWYGVRQHDTRNLCQRRIPVQWLEIGWWLLAAAGLIVLWPYRFPPGAYAAGVLCWYGAGRFWLEPLREQQDVVAGWRLNRVVAVLLVFAAGGVLLVILNESTYPH